MNIDPSAPADKPETAQMLVIHRALRRETALLEQLVASVRAGDAGRARAVAGHARLVLAFIHDHHDSEDRLIWPLLHQRTPLDEQLISAMEREHAAVDASVRTVRAALGAWEPVASTELADRLRRSLADLATGLSDHLDHEESDVLPLIHQHLTGREWQAAEDDALEHGPSRLRDKFVLAGMVLKDATAAETAWFMSAMPTAARIAWRLHGARTYARYTTDIRRDLAAASGSSATDLGKSR